MQRANDLVALAILVVLLAGCAAVGQSVEPMSAAATASTATPTVVPSSSSPVASPTPSADPVPGGLEMGRIAEIVTTGLVVRSLPEISDASVIDPVRVPSGYLAYIIAGPIRADGYDWYQVKVFPPTLSDVVESHPDFGWLAAAGKDGEPWIAPWAGECPERDWDGMMLSLPYVALACWGSGDVTLEGTLSDCIDQGVSAEPGWVFDTACRLVGPDYGELLAGRQVVWLPPTLDPPGDDGPTVRVTGHLDDPGAALCRPELVEGSGAPPELIALDCRGRFLITQITGL